MVEFPMADTGNTIMGGGLFDFWKEENNIDAALDCYRGLDCLFWFSLAGKE